MNHESFPSTLQSPHSGQNCLPVEYSNSTTFAVNENITTESSYVNSDVSITRKHNEVPFVRIPTLLNRGLHLIEIKVQKRW